MTKKIVSQILEKRCKGCGICVEFCPQKVFALNELDKAVIVNRDRCVGCMMCEYRCPDFAIKLDFI